MGKVKIYDLAKKLNLTSKEILERAEKLNIEAKSHLSNIDDADAQKIEDSFSNGIFIKRKAEYLIRISSNAEKYKYWEET